MSTPENNQPSAEAMEQLEKELSALKARGLMFSQCIHIFGEERDKSVYGRLAHTEHHKDGELEIDDTTVVSDSEKGAYVLAWVWVDRPETPTMSPKEYAQAGGNKCPYCGSTDITGGSVEIDDAGASQEVSCNVCDKTWTDTYKLTGYLPE